MQEVFISKAQPVGDEKIASVAIVLNREIPTFDEVGSLYDFMEMNADLLANTLFDALPGGTMDRLIAKLLTMKASSLVVPL